MSYIFPFIFTVMATLSQVTSLLHTMEYFNFQQKGQHQSFWHPREDALGVSPKTSFTERVTGLLSLPLPRSSLLELLWEGGVGWSSQTSSTQGRGWRSPQ